MESEKKQAMIDTYRQFMEIGLSSNDPGPLAEIIDERIFGFGTAMDEKCQGIKGVLELLKIQNEQSKGFDVSWKSKPVSHYTTPDENTAVFADDVYLTINTSGETIEMYLRISIVLNYTNNHWKVIHWHASKPEQVESEKDTWGIESWKQKAEELEKLVSEKTADLVEKNRDLEIEAALERVRASAMSMHKSDEIHRVIFIVAEQIAALGIYYDSAHFIEIHEDGSLEMWVVTQGQFYAPRIQVPFADTPFLNQLRDAKKTGIEMLEGVNSFEEKNSFFNHFFENTVAKSIPDKRKEFVFQSKGLAYTSFPSKTLSLSIANYQGKPYSKEENEIFKRFSDVFDQAYTRFLDLQKAEAQVREAQVEAALERVRSRSMAMHRSAELRAVVDSLYGELKSLQINFDNALIQLIKDNTKDLHLWISTADGLYNDMIHWPASDLPHFDMMHEARLAQSDVEISLTPDQINAFFEEYFCLPYVPQERRAAVAHVQYFRIFGTYQKNTCVFLMKYSPGAFSAFEKEIITRFSKVFEQTYTRFLDLQKAEAQAREAKIEAALERVRSRTIAMHNSQEVGESVAILFEELVGLGVLGEDERCGIGIMLPEEKMEAWTAAKTNDGKSVLTIGHLDMSSHSLLKSAYQGWIEKKDFQQYTLLGEDLISYSNAIESQPNYKIKLGNFLDAPRIIHSDFYFKEGCLYVFSKRDLSAESLNVYHRFAAVFGQTYRRYQDLQKAEAQAREAQIEAALERVRAQTMAMHSSEDVGKCVVKMFSELTALGVDEGTRFGIGILNHDNENNQLWTARKNGEEVNLHIGNIDMASHPLLKSARTAWKAQVPFHKYVLEGEDLLNYYQMLNNAPDYKIQIPIKKLPKKEIQHCFIFEHGFFYAFSPIEFQPELIQITKRFSSLFEQTYRRYLDLVKAEAQALEAIKRASVDRVRAEIASMRTTSDLERIQPLIWNELKILGVPFIRCGVFIMDQGKQEVQAFLSTPDGKSIAAFRLPYHSTEQTRQIVLNWQRKQSYKDHMDEAAFAEFTRNLVELGAMASTEKYVTENRPTDLYLHFLPFLQGMLYVGNDAPLKDEELQLVQNLAEAFSTAYARYEDFNKLELAKSAVEAAMSELKATQAQLVQQEKLASLGQLTAGIAHEIKNPLNFVNNFSEVSLELLDEVKETRIKNQETRPRTEEDEIEDEILEDIKANLKKIHEHGSRANGIVTAMLQHSRGGSGKMEPTDLNALIKEYMNLSFHGMRAGKNPIEVEVVLDLDKEIKEIPLVREDFTRVIINLCNNAFDAMRQKFNSELLIVNSELYHPKLTVRTKSESDHMLISVADNGPGIPDEIKDKILQPFFTTKKGTEGTGLGLSITHDIVKAHGGELRLESTIGKGSEFVVLLPNLSNQ